jgi:hypothetical protein
MLSQPTTIGLGVGGVIILLIIIMYFGSFITFILLLLAGAATFYYFYKSGYLKIKTTDDNKLDIDVFQTPYAPDNKTAQTTLPIAAKEVFYIAGNNYVYNEAAAVCAAYDADLATQDQVQDAYAKGGEWCGYGWTAGGMALYPTQKETWDKLQQEQQTSRRTACGRPGVNGGYFDPNTKFGVNCFGVKPGDTGINKYPTPLPGTDPDEFNKMVNSFKSTLDKMLVIPFNRGSWSEWNLVTTNK